MGQMAFHSSTAVPSDKTPKYSNSLSNCLEMTEIHHKLQGHVTQVDHTGINFPVALLPRTEWDNTLKKLATTAALYKYPTGEDWPFIIPATDAEFQNDIEDFVFGREPKFELVYDQFAEHPVMQFAFGTDLTRQEIEALFPEPYGIVFPELENIFRVIYVVHPWAELIIRFDIYYADTSEPSWWTTGQWLVMDGGRL